jgi:low temperature requirement protein LtrA
MTTPAGVMEEREVSPLELFYDLVFVFAVSQLSEHLVDDLTWRGAAETLVLLCAVFTVWLLTTFEATYFDITRRQTQVAVLTAMVLGLFMNAAIGVAFSAGGWAFVVPLVVTQVARGIVTSTTAPTQQLRQHYRRALTWLLASTPVLDCRGGSCSRIAAVVVGRGDGHRRRWRLARPSLATPTHRDPRNRLRLRPHG